jgi:hypothetical protein
MGNRNGKSTTSTNVAAETARPMSPRSVAAVTAVAHGNISIWRDTLPISLVASIMEWLSVYETLRLLRLCRNWRHTIYDDSHWRRLFYKHFGDNATIPPPLTLPWQLPATWNSLSSPTISSSSSSTTTTTTTTTGAATARSCEWYHRYRRRWRCEMTWRTSGLGQERIPAIPMASAAQDLLTLSSSSKSKGSSIGSASGLVDDVKFVGNHGVDQWSAAKFIHGTRVHGIDRQHATSIAMDDRIMVTGGYKGTLCIWNINQNYKLASSWHGVPENKQRTISTLWMDTTRDANLLAGSGNRNIALWYCHVPCIHVCSSGLIIESNK